MFSRQSQVKAQRYRQRKYIYIVYKYKIYLHCKYKYICKNIFILYISNTIKCNFYCACKQQLSVLFIMLNFHNALMSFWVYLTIVVAVTEYHKPSSLNNKYLFLTYVEAGRSRHKQIFCLRRPAWFIDSQSSS